jgi:hypothetical protein
MLKLSSSLLVLFLTFGSFTLPAQAQDGIYQVYRLPKGFNLGEDISDVPSSVQCFELDDYKLLLHMDNDLRTADQKIVLMSEEIRNLRGAENALVSAIHEADAQRVILQEDRVRFFELWKKENLAKHKAENRPMWGSWLPWTLAGVLAITTGGLLVSILVES